METISVYTGYTTNFNIRRSTKLESEKAKEALRTLNLYLRYVIQQHIKHQSVYRLTPIDAFKNGLRSKFRLHFERKTSEGLETC